MDTADIIVLALMGILFFGFIGFANYYINLPPRRIGSVQDVLKSLNKEGTRKKGRYIRNGDDFSTKHEEYVGSMEVGTYHYPDCPHAQRINPERKVTILSITKARNYGWRPCKTCNP